MAEVSTTSDIRVRKARVFPPLICARCETVSQKNSASQKFCKPCAREVERELSVKATKEKTALLKSLGRPVLGQEFPCADCAVILVRTGTRHVVCEDCAKKRKSAQDLRYRTPRRAEMAAKSLKWRNEHIEEALARSKKYRDANKEKLNAIDAAEYRANPEPSKQRAKAWYWKNREKVLARMSSESGRKYAREQMRKRLATEPQFKLHTNVSRAIRASVKDKKHRSWESLLGFSLADLVKHIERQFLTGMNWSNHGKGKGKWHIDHIVPQVSFCFTSVHDADFKACWAITNLRPLWSTDNISKHGNRTHLL